MNTKNIATLRPGLLVSLKTSVSGNVSYVKRTIERERVTATGAKEAKWETQRTITDPEEFETAQWARSKAAGLIRSACVASAFGLLCPEDKAEQLEAAIAEARQVAETFNAEAKLTRLHIYIIAGRIAQDDVEATRAISSEVRDLMQDMERGLANLDVKTVRQAAQQARNIGVMLSPAAQARIQIAVDAARESARRIVKAGEQAAAEIDRQTIKRIAEQRTAFIDLDGEIEIAAPKAQGRALDLDPSVNVRPAQAERRAIDVE